MQLYLHHWPMMVSYNVDGIIWWYHIERFYSSPHGTFFILCFWSFGQCTFCICWFYIGCICVGILSWCRKVLACRLLVLVCCPKVLASCCRPALISCPRCCCCASLVGHRRGKWLLVVHSCVFFPQSCSFRRRLFRGFSYVQGWSFDRAVPWVCSIDTSWVSTRVFSRCVVSSPSRVASPSCRSGLQAA